MVFHMCLANAVKKKFKKSKIKVMHSPFKHFFENCHLGTLTDFEKIGTDGIQAKNQKQVPNSISYFLPDSAEIRQKRILVYLTPIEPTVGAKALLSLCQAREGSNLTDFCFQMLQSPALDDPALENRPNRSSNRCLNDNFLESV